MFKYTKLNFIFNVNNSFDINMQFDNYIILTGAMGAGKSAVLNKLKELNYTCVSEPAREILAEQRRVIGRGVPEIDPILFTELMLARMIQQYKLHSDKSELVFFDRALPDLIGYADLFGIDNTVYQNAAAEFSFNKIVFLFNGWEDIYTTDDERKMSYTQANKFGIDVKEIYEDSGYVTHEVPFKDIDNRVKFIVDKVSHIAHDFSRGNI